MRTAIVLSVATALLLIVAAPALAQPFPVSGEVYLSFDPNMRVSSQTVTPFVPFDLYITVDIPVDGANPTLGIAGVEGGISFPSSIELMSIAFPPPAINIGPGFSEPELESFIVGLGVCQPLGTATVLGTVTARLLVDDSDIEIALDAPSVGAAAISSFAGIGPGWARFDCEGSGNDDLVLFEAPTMASSNVIVNPSVVATESSTFARVKALY